MTDFTHLCLHSEYSIDDSVIFLKRLAPEIKQRGMTSVALTDTNLFASLKFQSHCFDVGVKPIFGCDLKITSDHGAVSRLITLAMNDQGYRNLLKLVTRSYANPALLHCITRDELKQYSDGLIVLSGGVQGDIGKAILNGDIAKAEELSSWYTDFLKDRFYLEVARTGRVGENDYNEQVVRMADCMNLPLVATNDVVMSDESEMLLHDARLCMQRGESMDDEYSWKGDYSEQQFIRTPEQMAALFQDIPDAVENASEIAKRCNVEIPTGVLYQRPFPTEDLAENERILREKTANALEKILEEGWADETNPRLSAEAYRNRLETELSVIISMGYAGYFLIVQDMVQWAKAQKIPVGQGRGSGAASLVSMLLGITTVDPLQHKLLFERLLNPERRTMPDLDIDFCGNRRDEVAAYLSDKYGKEVVGRIVAHQTKGAKGAIQALGRSMGVAYSDVARITRLVPQRPIKISIKEALEKEPRIRSVARNLGCEELIEEAQKLEGIVSNLSYHPAGIVIAPGPLDDYVACHREGNDLISQLDKDDVEQAGLVKFDLLSLKNLTAIQKTVDMIAASLGEGEAEFDIDRVDLEDRATYELLSTGETQAVFQLGSREMQNLLRNVQPHEFKDVVAVIALYRPGPLNAGFHERYYKRKHHQEKVRYEHPKLASILEDNHGVMIYQEDVMNAARELAGFSLGDADIMREAMGKKRVEKLATVKDLFLRGCVENEIDEKIAQKIYSDMEGFAEYAFPRAHATAYAMLSYQTAYLKAHYTKEFMAANISVFMGDPKQVEVLLRDVLRMNIALLAPDVNSPSVDCEVVNGAIRLGFPCIKGCGSRDVSTIREAREAGEFSSLFDFCNRAVSQELSTAKVGYMIDAGVFDSFESEYPNLGAKRAVLHEKFNLIAKVLRTDSGSNEALFGGPTESMVLSEFKDPTDFTAAEVEEREREVLGQPISNRDRLANFKEFGSLVTHTIAEVNQRSSGQVVLIGTIEESYLNTTRNGEEFVTITLQDHTGKVRALLWPDEYKKYSRLIVDSGFVIAEGRINVNKNTAESQVFVSKLHDPASARKKWSAAFRLCFNTESCRERLTRQNLEEMTQIIRENTVKGGQELKVSLKQDNVELEVGLGKGFKRLPVTNETQDKLRTIFGAEVVNVQFQSSK